MTASEKAEWQGKASKVLKNYLFLTINYPNCDNREILNHLVQMWNELIHNKLIMPGMTFEMFASKAQEHYLKAELDRMMSF